MNNLFSVKDRVVLITGSTGVFYYRSNGEASE